MSYPVDPQAEAFIEAQKASPAPDISLLDRLESIPQYAQTQMDLTAQLVVVRAAAVRLGCYDASDWIGRRAFE